MKTFEIFFRDLKPEVQIQITRDLETSSAEENWDISPLAIIEREEEETCVNSESKRVIDWQEFSQHMESYIRESTLQKYSLEQSGTVDLISISDSRICIWNVLKYALRNLNGRGKEQDIEKMAHYASLAWEFSKKESVNKLDG